jgi:hypothetical protein
MAATVTVNGRTVVHAGSEGVSTAFPDWCLMSNGAVLPMINTAFSKDVTNCARSVFADGFPVANVGSYFATSTGNEQSLGGVISGRVCGKASFINWSFDVFVEGLPVPRLYDPMVHNHGSPGNAVSPGLLQPNVNVEEVTQGLCVVFCACNGNGNTYCALQHLACERWVVGSDGIRRRYWDPADARVYVEVPYDMSAPEGPEPILSSREVSARGSHLPLPECELPIYPKTRRPDVSIVRNRDVPLSRANLQRIADFKFDGDDFSNDQLRDYRQIDPTGEPIVIDSETCDCKDGKTRYRVRETVEDIERKPIPIPPPIPQDRKRDEEEERRRRRPVVAYAEAAFLLAAAAIIILDPVPGDEPALVPILARLGMLLK